MKYLVIFFCVLLGTALSTPVKNEHKSFFRNLGELLEKIFGHIENKGHQLLTKVVNLIYKLEEAIITVKESVPNTFEKIHQDADEVLAGLKKLASEVEELLGKKSGDIYYGFDILGGLTELTGGTKLSTVLSLLSLADKAHRVVQDAKEFVPHLEQTLNRIQDKIASHVSDLSEYVIKELGLQESVARSVVSQITDLIEKVEEKAHSLILNLLHNIEKTFKIIEKELPEIYDLMQESIDEIRGEIRKVLNEIETSLHMKGVQRSFGILDIAGDLTSGTSLGTAIRVVNIIDKFNTVVQDVRNFGPRSEAFLEHSVQKVANSAQDFLKHTANILSKSF